MKESGYYPMGAEFDPNAPWNESEPDEVTRDCSVWTAVTKTMSIPTTNYVAYDPYDGPDLSDVNWGDEFETRCRDIPEILHDLCELVRKYAPVRVSKAEARYIRELLEDADGWETDEIHVEEI
jgi:hypothetical protein